MTWRFAPASAASWLMAAPPAAKVRHHLRGDAGRIGRHPLRDHAVIAGEDEHFDAVEPRRRAPLPAGEPHHHLFQAPEAARRLGEDGVAARGRCSREVIPRRQIETCRPQVGEGCKAVHRTLPSSWNHRRPNRANDTKPAPRSKPLLADIPSSSFRGAGMPANPESGRPCRRLLDSGFAAARRPGMTGEGGADDASPGAALPPISK